MHVPAAHRLARRSHDPRGFPPVSCRICRGPLQPRFAVNGCRLVACARCGFVQVTEQPDAQQLEAMYEAGYFSHAKYADLATQQTENRRRLALMRRYLAATGARVLDAGCGSGDFIADARTHYTMSGFDISEAAITMARERLPGLDGRLWSGAFDALPDAPNEAYQAICLWDVIEHLWDPVDACRRLLGLLEPGGYLFISTPNIGAPLARLLGKGWAFMTPPEHLSFFTRQAMETLMTERLGQTVIDWSTRGKRVNAGFLLHKLRRKAPRLVPPALIDVFRRPPLAGLSVYVPSGDIQYVVVRKREA